jgi:hypothetical protein
MASCTLQHNTYGVVAYREASPAISHGNILSNTWNVYLDQVTGLAMPYCWWGAAPPDAASIWDQGDDFALGAVDTTAYVTSPVAW